MNELSRRPRSTAAARALWRQRFLQSGLLRREFAAQHGLKLSTLQRWVAASNGVSLASPDGDKSKLRFRSAPPGFAEVPWPLPAGSSPFSSAAASSPAWAAELIRPDGSTLRLARDVSGPLLKQLLRSC